MFIGSVALVRDPLGVSAHVGEVRLLVSFDRRGARLGRDLLETIFGIAHAHGPAKLTAAMTTEQQGSIALFDSLGFRAGAMLKDYARGRDGVANNLAILALNARRVTAGHQALGMK